MNWIKVIIILFIAFFAFGYTTEPQKLFLSNRTDYTIEIKVSEGDPY